MKVSRITSAHTDERGEISDLLAHQSIDAVTLITFVAGARRGDHYHRQTTQWTYVLTGVVNYYSQAPGSDAQVHQLRPGDIVCSPPNEAHAIQAETSATILVFTQGPRSGQDYESDTFRLGSPIAVASEGGV
jgi:quercetin dioxygenase-like cupin family protein